MEKHKKIYSYLLIFTLMMHIGLFVLKVERRTVLKAQTENRVRLVLRNDESKKNQPVQMAQTNKSEDKLEEVEAKFFSDSTNTFKKQTKARENGVFQNAGKGIEKALEDSSSVAKVAKTAKAPVKKKVGDISFKDFSFSPEKAQVAEKAIEAKQNAAAKGIENGDKHLTGLARTNDYLEHVPLGDMTNLNTTEHVYYGFYFRIKQQLEQHWGASLREKMEKVYKREGRFPASDKYITSIKVVLDEKGKILDIVIKGSSGVEELDQAAIESFNKAGPFPNPPKGMMQNGRASIEWGFAVTNS